MNSLQRSTSYPKPAITRPPISCCFNDQQVLAHKASKQNYGFNILEGMVLILTFLLLRVYIGVHNLGKPTCLSAASNKKRPSAPQPRGRIK